MEKALKSVGGEERMIDLTKGLVTSQLSSEELERYRAIPPPVKYGDIATLAVQDRTRHNVLATTRSYLSKRQARGNKQ